MRRLFIFLIILFLFLTREFPSYSDTIELVEGSILVGKVTSENQDTIVISNTYGNFKIKRNSIKSLYKTDAYTEDIKILKKLKAKINEDLIERHVKEGEKKKNALSKASSEKLKRSDEIWINAMIGVSGSFQFVLNEFGERIPYGYSGNIGIEQGMDMITGKRYIIMPGLRLEGGYMYFSKNSYKLSGFNSALGLIWVIPSIRNKTGYFIMAAMPGICFININNSEAGKTARSNTFTGTILTGYRLPIENFSVFLHARYMYLYDKNTQFHSIGMELGFGYKVW